MLKAVLKDMVLAEADRTVVVEGNHYFPPDSVRWEHLRPNRTRTLCPWKGIAAYLDAVIDDETLRNVAWTYRRPLPFARRIRSHVAFSPIVIIEMSDPDRSAGPTDTYERRS